ncbi:MAG: hypothetical protein RL215_2676 [Planctomycetota bacterium]
MMAMTTSSSMSVKPRVSLRLDMGAPWEKKIGHEGTRHQNLQASGGGFKHCSSQSSPGKISEKVKIR